MTLLNANGCACTHPSRPRQPGTKNSPESRAEGQTHTEPRTSHRARTSKPRAAQHHNRPDDTHANHTRDIQEQPVSDPHGIYSNSDKEDRMNLAAKIMLIAAAATLPAALWLSGAWWKWVITAVVLVIGAAIADQDSDGSGK